MLNWFRNLFALRCVHEWYVHTTLADTHDNLMGHILRCKKCDNMKTKWISWWIG